MRDHTRGGTGRDWNRHGLAVPASLAAVALLAVVSLLLARTSPAGAGSIADSLPSPAHSSQQPDSALAPTQHAPVPTSAAEAWFVPAGTAPAPAPHLRDFATGVQRFAEGNYAQALLLVSNGRLETTPLSAYASYYTALCYLRLARPAEARSVLQTLRSRPLEGFLREAVPLAEADAAAAAGDQAAAVRLLDEQMARAPAAPDEVLDRLSRAAQAAGDTLRAQSALLQLYYEHPTSPLAAAVEADVARIRSEGTAGPEAGFFERDLTRAERLFAARRFADAGAAFARLRGLASSDRIELVDLRLAECAYYQGQHRQAIERLGPFLESASRRAEARYFHLSALRALGRTAEFATRARQLASDFPDSTWSADALNALATYYILDNDDAAAADVFARIVEQFPGGRHYERAAWKLGWWRYKSGDHRSAASIFEEAAARVPRADQRPAWIYWAGRARDQAGDRDAANARFELTAVDYLHSYYGRLAATILEARGLEPGRLSPSAGVRPAEPAGHGGGDEEAAVESAPAGPAAQARRPARRPANAEVITVLLSVGLYEQAIDELQYARRTGGATSAIDATLAWTYARQGDLRRGINQMRQAYPQYIASGGEALPADVLHVIFPLDYSDLIRKHSRAHGVDPYVVAALVAQESSFLPAVRSPANAYGLMQIIPSTGRRLARAEGIRRFRRTMLTNPEVNVRLGTRYFAGLVSRFGSVHYALAAYNAGEQRVVRWRAERPGLERDEFIDDIPFPETQIYVKKILGSAEDYRRLYGDGRTLARAAVASPGPPSR